MPAFYQFDVTSRVNANDDDDCVDDEFVETKRLAEDKALLIESVDSKN